MTADIKLERLRDVSDVPLFKLTIQRSVCCRTLHLSGLDEVRSLMKECEVALIECDNKLMEEVGGE